MSQSSGAFYRVPQKAYRLRLAFLLVPLLWVALLAVGIIGFSNLNPLSPATRPASDQWNPLAATNSFYDIYFAAWSHGPEGCVSGDVQSDFQRARCEVFWTQMAEASVIAISPILILMLAYVLGMDSQKGIYRRARRKIKSRKAILKGVVTSPAVAGNDFFGWFYGFQAISVQVGRRAQLRVYFAPESRLPIPGDTVAVYSAGKALGQERYFGVYYAPHVAVIAGMTQD